MNEGTVVVDGGRRIGYAEYGVPDGIPLLEFHGVPGSRYYQLDHDALVAAGVRLLTVERPGFGLSDRSPGRTLLDWPDDVEAFADALALERFGVLGVSAGGPSALACGYALPDRVAVVGLCCAVGPHFDNPQFDPLLSAEIQALLPIARVDRDTALVLVRDFFAATADAVAADVVGYFDGPFLEGWSESDRPTFIAKRDQWIANLEATWGRGVETMVDESGATYGPWGFALADVRVPVRAWHGDLDPIPADVIQYVIDEVHDGALTVYRDEAHALAHTHHDDWLTALTAWAA
jgi:pimeloyl-ACP methyl ester carboxylesterase